MDARCDTVDAVADIDTVAWNRVRSDSGADVFSDPRFLRAVEDSMGSDVRMWHVLVRDGSGRPVAAATLSALRVDLAILSVPALKRAIRRLRDLRPSFLRPTVLFCGLPVSVGAVALVVAPDAEVASVVTAVDATMAAIARRHRLVFLCMKEFAGVEPLRDTQLHALGWILAPTLPANYFPVRHSDFTEYLSALRSRRRRDIIRSLKKTERYNIKIERVTDGQALLARYDEAIHGLYVAVAKKSAYELEVLPRQFFIALARAFPGELELVLAQHGERVVAFNWSIVDGDCYRLLFCGLDYALNETAGLYFAVMYAELDRAMRLGTTVVQMGQTADAFKARIGCVQEPRQVAVRGRAAPVSLLLRAVSRVLFTLPPAVRTYELYRRPPI
jgi:predicted N-acyltransferase